MPEWYTDISVVVHWMIIAVFCIAARGIVCVCVCMCVLCHLVHVLFPLLQADGSNDQFLVKNLAPVFDQIKSDSKL